MQTSPSARPDRCPNDESKQRGRIAGSLKLRARVGLHGRDDEAAHDHGELHRRRIAVLLRSANGLDVEAADRREFAAVFRDVGAARQFGHALTLGSATEGAAAIAILLPVGRDREPMTLGLGGPMKQIQFRPNARACSPSFGGPSS